MASSITVTGVAGRYLAILYTERLEAAGAVNSVGSKGDSFDNALAETVNVLYKAELETAAWVHWWNSQRLHSACENVPPAE